MNFSLIFFYAACCLDMDENLDRLRLGRKTMTDSAHRFREGVNPLGMGSR